MASSSATIEQDSSNAAPSTTTDSIAPPAFPCAPLKSENNDKVVVVDAGAAIKLQRIENFGSEFFTTEEVHGEIKDSQARRHLQTLPFDLQQKQPFKEDYMFVKAFAKETGDVGFLSHNDMGLLALAVRLHRESGSTFALREKPEMSQVSQKRVPFSWAPREGFFRDRRQSSASKDEDFFSRDSHFGGDCDTDSLATYDLESGLEDDHDSVTDSALRSQQGDHTDEELVSGENDVDVAERELECVPEDEEEGEDRQPSNQRVVRFADAENIDENIDEDVVSSGEAEEEEVVVKAQPPAVVTTPAAADNSGRALSWAERAAAAKNLAQEDPKKKEHHVHVIDVTPPAPINDFGVPETERKGYTLPTSKPTANRSSDDKVDLDLADDLSRKLDFGEKTTPASTLLESAEESTSASDEKKDEKGKSRILNSSFAQETIVNPDEEDSESDDDDGWVTVDNINRLQNVVEANKGSSSSDSAQSPICILSTDYSVQNVAIQMGLQALSIDGFRIRSVKLWGKICRACFHTTRDTTKIYCAKCGNPTLDRCPYTLDADGRLVMHDNRRRKPNLRGTIYSIPKRRGGRCHDLLFREDERMMGGRDRQQKYEQKLAEKQRQIREKNGDDVVDGWCARHITGTGNTVSRNPNTLKHGYGRRNPNSNNFRGQKFK
ncbi:unnamed protein product [Amoebophrya sp. A25]|nr:unnamed protein product [Amoebophrya sp. A25]|eukprot:GSA25T00010348001.1